MRIGVYASMLASERGHEHNVSGHIQVPAQTVRLLHEAGHEVHLITNEFGPQHTFPARMPGGMRTHFVIDARVRPEKLRGAQSTDGVRPLALLKQAAQIRHVVRSNRIEVLHVFGFVRTVQLGGALRVLRLGVPVVATILSGDVARHGGRPGRWLLRRLDALLSATEYAAQQYERLGARVTRVRHGIVRDLRRESGAADAGERCRVLFWRDANEMNGGDLCLAAFEALAPRFPDVSFDLAIRPAWNEVAGIDDLARRHPNVHVHRFPYEAGMSLARVMNESLLVILPFRRLSIDPQFAIAESLAAGVPVITTTVQSNPELVEPGVSGDVIPPGEAQPLIDAMAALLADRPRLLAMGRTAAERFAQRWNWSGYVASLEGVYRSTIDARR